MGKGLNKIFSTVVNEISQELTPLGESGSEISHFIPEPRNFAEVTKLSENTKEPWLRAILLEPNPIVEIKIYVILFIRCLPLNVRDLCYFVQVSGVIFRPVHYL